MGLLTIEKLQTSLEKDLAWRKREISTFRMFAQPNAQAAEVLLKAGMVILCAHWEGFLKRAVELYIDHVFSQKLLIKQLTPVFIALSYFSDVKKAGEANYPGSEETHIKLAKRIALGNEQICEHSEWKAKTEGNPGTEVINRLLSSIGLDSQLGLDGATWATTKIFIDEQVVRDRHVIAHGEWFKIESEDFLKRTDRVLTLLDKLCENLLDAAKNFSYKI